MRMMRQRLRERVAGERGYTLIELLVVMILLGILAAIALAVFLNQADKGKDADAKSAVTNIARAMQACSAGSEAGADFRNCDSAGKIPEQNFKLDPAVNELPSGGCGDPNPSSDLPASGFNLKIVEASKDCFTVLGTSGSGNVFWYVKHDDGTVTRDCVTHNSNGCPASGQWAG